MEDRVWKTAQWDLSWAELHGGKYTVQGNCSFSAENGALLDIPFGDMSETRELEETGYYERGTEAQRYEYIYGITQDGERLVLGDVLSYGVGSSFAGGNKEVLKANIVFSARHEFDPQKPVTSVDFEIDGIREWFGISCQPNNSDGITTFDYNEGHKSLTLYSSEKETINLLYGIRSPKKYEEAIKIPIYAYIRVDYSESLSLDEIWSGTLWKLDSLFAFLFGSYPSIKWVRIRFDSDEREVQVFRGTFSSGDQEKLAKFPPISFSFVGKEFLSGLVEKWMVMNGDERYAVEVLTSLLGSWNMPIDLKLLASTTMLEALIRAKNEYLYDKEELDKFISPMLDVADEEIRNRARGLLELLRRPSYPMLLDAAIMESGQWGHRLIPNWRRFKKEQIQLRHAGAHGLGSSKELKIVIDHYYAQIVLAYIIVMKRLGCSDKLLDEFEKSTFLNSARWQITKHYAHPEESSK